VSNDIQSLGFNKSVLTSPHAIYDIFGEPVSKSAARAELKLGADEHVVLFFGFVRAYKGLDLLLQALADNLVRPLKIKLIVAGEFYEEKKKYTDLIKVFGLEGTVIIRDDYIPEDRVKYYFAAADLVAQTYKTATQSGVTQIAYHFDKPMLVTDVGGLSEIVEDGVSGYVVDPEPQAIAQALYRYFTESREESFTHAVRQRKDSFSWSFFTKKFLSFAKSL
jgi:glycosyltransferase involved in cell wall biosynthesis